MFTELAAESTLKFVSKAKSLAKEVVANLGLGEPDKSPPKGLLEHMKEAMKVKPTYTPSAGLSEAKEAVAEWLSERYSVDIDPKEVMITPSGKAALFLALTYASEKYRAATLHDPTYYSYEPVLKAAGVKVRKVPMLKGDRSYEFPRFEGRKDILVINSPNNPTGAVMGEEMLEVLNNYREAGGLVISDEAYDVFVYEGRHVSLLQYERWRDVGLFVYSFSKVFCVPGWRLGAIVAKEEIIKKLAAAASNVYGCPAKWEQIALAKFLKENKKEAEEHVREMVEDYSKRRELIERMLNDVSLFSGIGKGAFYAFPQFNTDGESLALELAKRGVITIPGSIFSEKYGKNSLRISFSAPLKELEVGLSILRDVLREG